MTLTNAVAAKAPGTQSVLAVRDLTVSFPPARARRRRDKAGDLPVLDQVDLDVGDGEFVAVLGPSGCGKSTLLRALGGLLDPRAAMSGEVHVPRDTHGNRMTAWMPQRDGLLPWRRALSNAMVGAIAAGVDRDHAQERARELFSAFGLAGFENAWPSELSGGMRQRLALLRTCLSERPVLLLDEPFGALDPVTRRRMNTWLAGMRLTQRTLTGAPSGRAVVLVTHDVDEAIVLADRIVVLSERPGRVVHEVRAAGAESSSTKRYDRASLLAALDFSLPG